MMLQLSKFSFNSSGGFTFNNQKTTPSCVVWPHLSYVYLSAPAILTLEFHEANPAQISPRTPATFIFVKQYEMLLITVADRNHHPTPCCQLLQQFLGYRLGCSGNNDSIIRCLFPPAFAAITYFKKYILIANRLQPLLSNHR